ncbi:hypothetical protein FW778_07710 [Ginsengibacter hankyongi]|uniref:Uncharacterized protein n=1 Tax=Ginsengibacter hankyongi TaxID=2607284 RepID=A0A5J5IQL8_9BACT|nr:hypothetical protein [Ginsengibacter hankyongi]KAA9041892.1 hypothetical protein FW778_07710 [Ginsengibacter hankyongi]
MIEYLGQFITIRDTGKFLGIGSNSFKGIHSVGAHGDIRNNVVDSTGFNGIANQQAKEHDWD